MRDLKKIKIILVLVLSFLTVQYLQKDLFLANTPRLRLPIQTYLASKIGDLFVKIKEIASLFPTLPKEFAKKASTYQLSQQTLDNIKKASLKPLNRIAAGTYAATEGNATVIEFKENEVEWIEYTYNLNGKEIKIRVPKGQAVPSQETVEKFYQ